VNDAKVDNLVVVAELDVCSDASVKTAVEKLLAAENRIGSLPPCVLA
jgi:hypothetical protein